MSQNDKHRELFLQCIKKKNNKFRIVNTIIFQIRDFEIICHQILGI